MGRRKSSFRKKFNSRWLRWRASKAAVTAAPFLKKKLNFLGAGVALQDIAQTLLHVDDTLMERPLRDDQIDFIRTYCQINDGAAEPKYWEAPWRFRDEHFLLCDAWMLGHTGRLVDQDFRGVITGWGEAENWNRDRAALLGTAAHIEGIAIPIRPYKSYFHFFMDVAIPLTAYFESENKARGRHVLLHTSQPRQFARTTLAALARRYDCDMREIGAREKAICAQAVYFRRTQPCRDWFAVRPEIIRALKSALAAQQNAQDNGAEKLYLRRGKEKLRNLSNGDALDALATAKGFKVFQPADDNFAEQIAHSAAARSILAVHGAALTNLIFAEPGAEVTEIFSADFCKSVYLSIAQMMGHTHRAIICAPGDYRQNFQVDSRP